MNRLRACLGTLCMIAWCVVAQARPYIVNGLALDVERAMVRGNANLLAAQVQRNWAAHAGSGQAPIVRRNMTDRIVLGRRVGQYVQSVSFTPDHARHAVQIVSSTTSLRQNAAPRPARPWSSLRWAWPQGTQIDSVIEGKGADAGTTVVGRSQLPVAAFAAAMNATAHLRGWSTPYVNTAPLTDTRLLVWARNGLTASLRIRADHSRSRFVLVQTSGTALANGFNP